MKKSPLRPKTPGSRKPSGPRPSSPRAGDARPAKKLTDRQKAAAARRAAMSPEERRTHDENQARNPHMAPRVPGQIRVTALVIDELTAALSTVLKLDGPADVLMSLYFRRNPHLGSRDRSMIAEGIFYAMRRLATLSWMMQPAVPARVPRMAALVTLARQYGRDALDERAVGRDAKPLDNMLSVKMKLAPASVQAEVSPWLYDAVTAQYPDANALFESIKESAPLDLRVNLLKAKREEILEDLNSHGVRAEATPYSPEGVRVFTKPNLTAWPIFRDGKIDVQDEGSQLIARLVQPRRGEMVVDFCAGAGGKTLALGALMRSTGRLYAFDVNEKRLAALTPRMRRAGLSNVHPVAIRNEADLRVKRLNGKVDRVLVDAPCSGTGTLRRNPDLKWRFDQEEMARINEIQHAVIRAAAKMLKRGGRLVYATCSLLEQENQQVIEDFLAEHPEFELVSAPEVLAAQGVKIESEYVERFGPYFVMLPHLNNTDGFFGAVLERID
ncbi:MAG: RsmB/NOP family class I SAM-dependent RNA methyltransferase [Burkholderiaceae bacterium]